jgi:hypothetical protein
MILISTTQRRRIGFGQCRHSTIRGPNMTTPPHKRRRWRFLDPDSVRVEFFYFTGWPQYRWQTVARCRDGKTYIFAGHSDYAGALEQARRIVAQEWSRPPPQRVLRCGKRTAWNERQARVARIAERRASNIDGGGS